MKMNASVMNINNRGMFSPKLIRLMLRMRRTPTTYSSTRVPLIVNAAMRARKSSVFDGMISTTDGRN